MTAITPALNGHDGFGQLLHAEWTKFRTVRGWVTATIVAILVTGGIGVFVARGTAGGGQPIYTLGPGGEPVRDDLYFVRQPLAGDGSITVRVTSLATQLGSTGLNPPPSVLIPWSKAGILIKDGTGQGSAYAAMMVTGSNGVRMQWDYTGDTPGMAGAVSAANPRWLRLNRAGGTITGYDSADGTHWTRVGAVTLAGLPSTVQAGLFVASPPRLVYITHAGGGGGSINVTEATAVFDRVGQTGTWPAGGWTGDDIGAGDMGVTQGAGGYRQAAGQFTVTGSGDIAPVITGPGEADGGASATIGDLLIGTFIGLTVLVVVATMFMTAEYRRGLIRTTLAASRGRVRVLAAKAIVIGSTAFAAGLVAAAVAVVLGKAISAGSLFPEPEPTELRLIAGTAALVAVTAVLTVAVATVVRRSAATILIVTGAVVIPYFLSVAPGLPAGVTGWLMRVTPGAAFALQQAAPRYYQVQASYATSNGYFPLAPWTGFAVLCGWTALALLLAAYLLRRRDA